MPDKEQTKKFAERLNLALDLRRMRAIDLCQMPSIDKASIRKYRKVICMPARGRILDISNALNVSVGWLLGYSNDMYNDLLK